MINTDFLNTPDFLNNFDFLNNLHFIRPEWFFSAIPLIVLYVWLRTRSTKYSGWQSVIPAHLYSHMVVGKVEKGKRPPLWLLPFTWCIALVALAGPTWERLPQPVYQLKMGHVVVLDMSMSMRATDMTPDRLTRAKYKAIDLINAISEGEMGLVAYAGDAFVISPLTEDAANITSLLPSLSPEIMPVPGSDPLLGIEAAAELLTNAGFTNGAIYWITDGIEFGQQQELQEYVGSIPFKVNALTVGTAEGAPIRQLNGELLKDASGSIVIPKLKENVVRGVIKASGGQLESLTSNDDDIEALSATSLLERDTKDSSEEESNPSGDQWKEVGPYLVLLILPFAAFAFRRGLLFFVVVGVLVPFESQIAQAQTPEQTPAEPPTQTESESGSPLSWWQTPFLNADQEGLNSYQQAQFQDAAEQFENKNWKASALYKANRFEEALAAYQDVPGMDSLYNQGNALAKLGKLEAAIQKYNEVLEQQPDHKDAEANKSLLEELLSQQQQQQKQEQEQENQENGQQDGDQSEQDQQQGEQSQGSENESNSESENSAENKAEQQNSEQNEGPEQKDQKLSDEQTDEQGTSGDQNEREESTEPNEQNGNLADAKEEQRDDQDLSGGLQAQQEPLTDAEKEEMQRMENLMRRVPDDPAFLLKRKMQLEAEKRKRQRMPSNRRDW